MTRLGKAAEELGLWLARQGVDISQPINAMVLRRAILETRGTDSRTLEKWVKMLREEGKIQEVSTVPPMWKLII